MLEGRLKKVNGIVKEKPSLFSFSLHDGCHMIGANH
ncbi:unnamed protein product [Musa acuminata subsp. malaccensis]|uniref:(wild Malaysian banana) hypothetical protein n=1 Tax=Musa acuminata subsp. malaccensis TaxID=214687 RepID=A0A804J173_MUSAM|nr:unnamed protein product [Musa acuminata subsp. malaccensis]